jgi:hypothetical protein
MSARDLTQYILQVCYAQNFTQILGTNPKLMNSSGSLMSLFCRQAKIRYERALFFNDRVHSKG